MLFFRLRLVARALLREILLASAGSVCCALLTARGESSLAALAAIAAAAGAGLVLLVGLRGGELARAFRFVRLRHALGAGASLSRLESPRLLPIAEAGEAILDGVAGAPAPLRGYLEPMVWTAVEIAGRSLRLSELAEAKGARLVAADRDGLLEGEAERRSRLETEPDPEVRRRLEASVRALESQREAHSEDERALAQIEAELDAAAHSLASARLIVEKTSRELSASLGLAAGALEAREELQSRVDALAHSITEVGGAR